MAICRLSGKAIPNELDKEIGRRGVINIIFFGCALAAIRPRSRLAPVRLCPCRANSEKESVQLLVARISFFPTYWESRDLRASPGVIPNFFLKVAEKWETFLKPTSKHTSETRRPRLSNSTDARSRRSVSQRSGDSSLIFLKSRLKVDRLRPDAQANSPIDISHLKFFSMKSCRSIFWDWWLSIESAILIGCL